MDNIIIDGLDVKFRANTDSSEYVSTINNLLIDTRSKFNMPISEEIFNLINHNDKINTIEDFYKSRESKFRVIINPHGGKGQSLNFFMNNISPILNKCSIQFDLDITEHSGHAYEMGVNHDCTLYEGVILAGGDGIINEFINGILSRPHGDVITYLTPFTIFPFGSQNGLAEALGISTYLTSLHSVIKKSFRPLDGIQIRTGDGNSIISLSGISFGIASDMVLDYEQTRNLKSFRYPYLKVKYGLFKKRIHGATIHYLADDTKDELVKCHKKTPDCEKCKESSLRDIPKVFPLELDDIDITNLLSKKKMDITSHLFYWQSQRNLNLPSFLPSSTFELNDLMNEMNDDGNWTTLEEDFLNIGIVNANSEAEFSHASDGYMDLMLNKNGGPLETFDQLLKYVSGNMMKSSLFAYKRVKRVILEPKGDPVANNDGEILPLTSLICFDLLKSYFTVYGER